MTSQQIGQWLMADGRLTACHVHGPLQARDNSWLFHAQCTGVPGAMAVKVCLMPRSNQADPAAARRQFDTLVQVHAAMGGNEEFSVPQPYVLLADAGLLGTEWVEGRNMAALIFSWQSSTKALSLVARAARWLRRFHDCHVLPAERLDVQEKLAFAATLDGSVTDDGFRRALDRLRESAAAAGDAMLPRSWVHGDFTADNLMVAGSRTLGIDIDARHENTVVHDLAPFLNYLELRAFHPGGWRRLVAREMLGRAFLETYLAGRAVPLVAPLAWLRLYLLLQGWNTAVAKSGSKLRRSFIALSYGTVASRLTKVLEVA